MRRTSSLRCLSLAILAAACGAAQTAAPPQPSREIEVSLELRQANAWQAIDPQTVLRSGDEIRFRFRSAAGGYLYVFDVSSSGESAWLFPRPGQQQFNHVEPHATYIIPGQNGSFALGGKPGFDIVYWAVSPENLDTQVRTQPGTQPNTLRPRCREGPLKERGLCLDERAGPSAVPETGNLPFAWSGAGPPLASRDLSFRSDDTVSRVTPSARNDGIVIYQFRIAHQ
jgi:hypothetical protein